MRELPVLLRRYLWLLFLATALVVAAQAFWLIGGYAGRTGAFALVQGVVVFTVLGYAGQRTRLQVSGSVSQTLGTAVHIAAILLFPAPLPTFITLAGAAVSNLPHKDVPLYKRAFNVCHPVLTVALAGALVSLRADPTSLLHPGRVLIALPYLALLVALYYVLDVGTMLGVLTLLQGRPPWVVWWQTYRRTLLPELATSTIGIIGAVAWWFDPVLLALFVLPVVALGVAFRAIAAEDRAAALRRRGEQLEAVLAVGEHLRLQRTQVGLLQPVAEAARSLVGASSVAAYLRTDEDPPMLERVLIAPPDATVTCPQRLATPDPDGAGYAHDSDVLLVPLEAEGMGLAGLLRLNGVPVGLEQDDRDVLAILATQAVIALQNARMHERALAQASEDGLTGLLNHRAFQACLEEKMTQARDEGNPVSLMMIDLDDFRTVNNTYGHQAGDAALSAVAALVQSCLRATDVAARYGGDEFAVILPATAAPEAHTVATRMLEALAGATFESSPAASVGASIGIAAYPDHARNREDLVRQADQAAYAAKHAGKGRIGRPEDLVDAPERDPAVLVARLEHANMATVEALAAAVDAKDPYTRGHSQRVSSYAAVLAIAMGLHTADVARIRLAGLLHDVGKIGIPDAILTKSGKLSAEEYAIIQQHPVIGESMLAQVPFLRDILPAVRHHHERWDGAGYPDALVGAAIPADAAVLAVADALDAMTSSRTYRPALPMHEAARRVREGSGAHFDATVVAAFERALAAGTIDLAYQEHVPEYLHALAG